MCPAIAAGRRLGPWRLTERLGVGGMGEVWQAERADGAYSARAAVKLLSHGALSGAVIQAERSVLSRLEHPDICRLLDGGTAADGTSYLVVEFVDGVPVDRYCDEQRLDVDERLRLLLRIGEALSWAHGKLVVHRDLKPANILVTADGAPKLLDFGIARLLDGGDVDGPVQASSAHAAAEQGSASPTPFLTVGNASPEQLRGEPAAIADDVWAMGVLLTELLAGAPPFELSGKPLPEQARIVSQSAPRPPSRLASSADDSRRRSLAEARSTSSPRLVRCLAGDLDAIAAMALRDRAAQRYASVDHLLDDLRRHLSSRPVLAMQGDRLYRTQRFVRRHRLGLSGAALVLTGLAVAHGVVLGFLDEQREAEALARERAVSAEAARDKETVARSLAEQRLDEALEARDAADAALEAEAERRAEAEQRTEEARAQRAAAERAADLETVAREFVALLLATPDRSAAPGEARLVNTLDEGVQLLDEGVVEGGDIEARMRLMLARSYRSLGRHEEAGAQISQALGLLRAAPEDDDLALARTLTELSLLRRDEGLLERAAELAGEALNELSGKADSEALRLAETCRELLVEADSG